MKRYYNIMAGVDSDLNLTLRLYYADAELNGFLEDSLYIKVIRGVVHIIT